MLPSEKQHWQPSMERSMCSGKFGSFYILDDLIAFIIMSRISTFFPDSMVRNLSKMVHILNPSFSQNLYIIDIEIKCLAKILRRTRIRYPIKSIYFNPKCTFNNLNSL